MKSAVFSRLICITCLALAPAATQAAVEAAASPHNVSVHYIDPGNFTEARRSFGVHLIDANAYLKPLKTYIAKRASRILAPGQRLDIEVTDVDRAGEYEPWRGPEFNDIRIVKSIYPPRIDLNFTLYGADGKVLREGSRKLRDAFFLSRGMGADQDLLRYEKSLVDRWLRHGTNKL